MKIELNEANFMKIFSVYRSINRSHRKTPSFDEVNKIIIEKGNYEFIAGPKENWTSKLEFKNINNECYVDFVINENNTSLKIIKHLNELREKFLIELDLIYKDG